MTGRGRRNHAVPPARRECRAGDGRPARAAALHCDASRGGDAVGDEAERSGRGDGRGDGRLEPAGAAALGPAHAAAWNRGPEPRVRFGQTLLPGLACLGPADRAAGAALLAEADALREGRLTLLGRVTPCRGEIDWAGRDATPSWRVALHGLEHLIPAGFAAVLAESPEERADVVGAGRHASPGLADPRSSRTRRGRAARGADQTGHQPDPARHHLPGRAAGRSRSSSGAPRSGLRRRDVARRHPPAPSRGRLAGRGRGARCTPRDASSTARSREAGSRPPRPSCGASSASWCTTTAGCAIAARRGTPWS